MYYNTGEDQHATIARRYGIPVRRAAACACQGASLQAGGPRARLGLLPLRRTGMFPRSPPCTAATSRPALFETTPSRRLKHPHSDPQMMSVRDSLYDVMFDANNPYGLNRSEILVDIVHGETAPALAARRVV